MLDLFNEDLFSILIKYINYEDIFTLCQINNLIEYKNINYRKKEIINKCIIIQKYYRWYYSKTIIRKIIIDRLLTDNIYRSTILRLHDIPHEHICTVYPFPTYYTRIYSGIPSIQDIFDKKTSFQLDIYICEHIPIWRPLNWILENQIFDKDLLYSIEVPDNASYVYFM